MKCANTANKIFFTQSKSNHRSFTKLAPTIKDVISEMAIRYSGTFNSVRYKPDFNISKCAFPSSETVPSGIKYISNAFDPLEMQGALM